MKSVRTIQREVRQLHRQLGGGAAYDDRQLGELWGAMQALEWALGRDAARASVAVGLPMGSPDD